MYVTCASLRWPARSLKFCVLCVHVSRVDVGNVDDDDDDAKGQHPLPSFPPFLLPLLVARGQGVRDGSIICDLTFASRDHYLKGHLRVFEETLVTCGGLNMFELFELPSQQRLFEWRNVNHLQLLTIFVYRFGPNCSCLSDKIDIRISYPWFIFLWRVTIIGSTTSLRLLDIATFLRLYSIIYSHKYRISFLTKFNFKEAMDRDVMFKGEIYYH